MDRLKRQGSRYYVGLPGGGASHQLTTNDVIRGMLVLEVHEPLLLDRLTLVLKCEEYSAAVTAHLAEDIKEENYRHSVWIPRLATGRNSGVHRTHKLHFQQVYDIKRANTATTAGSGTYEMKFQIRLPSVLPPLPSCVALTTIGIVGVVWRLEFHTGIVGEEPYSQVLCVIPPIARSDAVVRTSNSCSVHDSRILGWGLLGKHSHLTPVTGELLVPEHGYPTTGTSQLVVILHSKGIVQVKKLNVSIKTHRTSTAMSTVQKLKTMVRQCLELRPPYLVVGGQEGPLELSQRVNLSREWFEGLPPSLNTPMNMVTHIMCISVSLVPAGHPGTSSTMLELEGPILLRGSLQERS